MTSNPDVTVNPICPALSQTSVAIQLFLICAAAIVLPVIAHRARHGHNGYMTYKHEIAERNLDAETLIVGPSASLFGISPKRMPHGAVSLAGLAQDLYCDCALAEQYVPRMPHLKRVVVPLCAWSWDGSLEAHSDRFRTALYWYEFDIPPARTDVISLAQFATRASRVALRESLHSRQPNRFDTDGSALTEVREPLTADLGKKTARKEARFKAADQAPRNVDYVTRLADQCHKHDVELVLVSLPCHDCYRVNIDRESVEQMHETAKRIAQKPGVRYLNYFDDPRFVESHFSDCSHLNSDGAVFLTSVLTSDLKIESE